MLGLHAWILFGVELRGRQCFRQTGLGLWPKGLGLRVEGLKGRGTGLELRTKLLEAGLQGKKGWDSRLRVNTKFRASPSHGGVFGFRV